MGTLSLSATKYYRISVSAFFFIQGLVFSSWASRIPDIKRALSLSDGALGLALFAAPTGEFAAVAVAALLIKRWGSQAVILAGLPCYAVCLTGLGLAPSLPFLAAALFLFGFASNTFNIALNAQAVDVECLYKRPIMSTFHGMWSLGGVDGGTLGAIVAPLGLPPLPHFIIMCAVTCLVTFSVRHRILPHDLPRKFTPKKHRGFTMPSCFILLLGFIAFSNMATEGTMYDWSAVYFAQVVRPGEALVRAGYIACMICMVCCRFIADRLVVRFGAIRVLQFGGLCTAAGFLLSQWLASAWLPLSRSATRSPQKAAPFHRAWPFPSFPPSASSACWQAPPAWACSRTSSACRQPSCLSRPWGSVSSCWLRFSHGPKGTSDVSSDKRERARCAQTLRALSISSDAD